jgi:hypothetical protein
MLNNLKSVIRKKKLYFIVKSSVKNIDILYSLLVNKTIIGFTKYSQNAKTFLLVLINYNHNFKPSTVSIAKNSYKLSKQQNKIVDSKLLDSNFVKNVYMGKSVTPKYKKEQRAKYIKFR